MHITEADKKAAAAYARDMAELQFLRTEVKKLRRLL